MLGYADTFYFSDESTALAVLGGRDGGYDPVAKWLVCPYSAQRR